MGDLGWAQLGSSGLSRAHSCICDQLAGLRWPRGDSLSVPHGLLSSSSLAGAYSQGREWAEAGKCSGGLGLELAQYHCLHSLLANASHPSGPDSQGGDIDSASWVVGRARKLYLGGYVQEEEYLHPLLQIIYHMVEPRGSLCSGGQ